MFDKLQKSVEDVLDLPPDVLGDEPKITIIGRQEIVVENFIEIVTFTDEEVRLSTIEGELCFLGKNFVLRTIFPTEIRIEGELFALNYGGRGSEK